MEQDQQSFYSRAAAGGTAAVGESPPARTDSIDQGPRSGAVREALALLLEPGGVAELRAIGRDGRVASGYFDDPALLAATADHLDTLNEYSGCYVTLNPVAPALLARRANRVVFRLGSREATTADGDILARRWLPIDIDPVRPSGISATEAEREAALGVAERVRRHLDGLGWPPAILADSGNGVHLLYRVDLSNDAASTTLVKGVLAALDARFSTAAAKVDTANHNAARIWKLYGTVSRKGDSTADRPHRRSAVLEAPRPAVVPADLLRALASPAPGAPDTAPAGGVDLRAWLEGHGIAVASERPWQGGTLYDLAQCPFSDAHRDGAYVIRFGDGGVHAGCHHDSCGGGRQRWPELRARFEDTPPPPPASPAPVGPPPAGAVSAADPAVVAAAREVLERGDPVAYFLTAFARDHVGDRTLARCLVASIASQVVRNTRGLHVYVTGESGKGKSSGMTAMLRQVPEEYRLAERLSNKALYYSDDISPGTVLLLDDIALSEELQEVLKEATSRFAEPVWIRTVDTERKVRRYAIPERCAWWLANVQALYDVQVLNRMLVCWVDDSEAQDREVFVRRMAAVARGDDDSTADRFDLAVCRELWRQLRADGLVTVRIPFADRIRLASLRNRRNPDVLLDLVRSRALVFRFQRRSVPGAGNGSAIEAIREDFEHAALLFADLHASGGSLGDKVDRNEDLVLALAARYGVEEFTIADVQRWTGWSYDKARRVMMGHVKAGTRHPGLLDRSPALSVLDRTTSGEDPEGRPATCRQRVFVFDAERHREARASGLAWLEDEPAPARPGEGRTDGAAACAGAGAHTETCAPAPDPGSEPPVRSRPGEHAPPPRENPPDGAAAGRTGGPCAPGPGACSSDDPDDIAATTGSGDDPASVEYAREHAPLPAPGLHRAGAGPDPRRFVPTDVPVFEPCMACGRTWSHFREARGPGRLCRACYDRAAARERQRGPPLPAVIDAAALVRTAAGIGRCDVCGTAPARWHGGRTRLCDACCEREVRRGIVRRGAPAEGSADDIR